MLVDPINLFNKVSDSVRLAMTELKSLGIRHDGKLEFYGWPVISMRWRSAISDRGESRQIYAHLYREDQTICLIRAVTWDGGAWRKATREAGIRMPVVLPTKYVVSPVDLLNKWLGAIEDQRIINISRYEEDQSAPVRNLRVERDYLSDVFEISWRNNGIAWASINNLWNSLWSDIERYMNTVTEDVSGLDEEFSIDLPEIVFDSRSYVPLE